ncbi:MAG: TetR/AcrR family transcriptional regulator [Hyphomonas sp.]
MSIFGVTSNETGKRARSKAANRRAILEAGRLVFARIGFEACTVRDIIRETELASGTFYNYFKSKEEVFEAIAEDSALRFRERLTAVRARTDTLEGYIREAFFAYFSFLVSENGTELEEWADQNHPLIGVRIDTPEMKATAREIRTDLERILTTDHAPEVDVEYLTAAYIGIARDLGEVMLTRRPVDVEGATEFATKLALAGFASVTQQNS